MMSMTCRTFDGRAVLDFVACGCSSNALLDRYSVRNYSKANSKGSCRGYGARPNRIRCGVSSMKTAQTPVPKMAAEALLNGVPQGLPQVLNLTKESRKPVSLTNLFEVVANDLLTLNQNLHSVHTSLLKPESL